MPESDRIVYGWMTGPGFHRPVRALVRTLAHGRRVWRSIGALRWVPLPRGAQFTPDPVQPRGA